MINISKWAKENPKTAQIIIITNYVLIAYLGLRLGILLQSCFILLPVSSVDVFSCILILASVFYPISKNSRRAFIESFLKRKILDSVLILSFACLMITTGNQLAFYSQTEAHAQTPNATFVVHRAHQDKAQQRADKRTTRQFLKAERKKLKQTIRAIVKSEREKFPIGAKIALTILLSIGLIAAAYGTVWLACSLACAGSGTASVLVVIGGGLGIVAAGIFGFRGIYRKK